MCARPPCLLINSSVPDALGYTGVRWWPCVKLLRTSLSLLLDVRLMLDVLLWCCIATTRISPWLLTSALPIRRGPVISTWGEFRSNRLVLPSCFFCEGLSCLHVGRLSEWDIFTKRCRAASAAPDKIDTGWWWGWGWRGCGANQDHLLCNWSWQGRYTSCSSDAAATAEKTLACFLYLRWRRLENLITFWYVTDPKSSFFNCPTQANFIHWCFLIHVCLGVSLTPVQTCTSDQKSCRWAHVKRSKAVREKKNRKGTDYGVIRLDYDYDHWSFCRKQTNEEINEWFMCSHPESPHVHLKTRHPSNAFAHRLSAKSQMKQCQIEHHRDCRGLVRRDLKGMRTVMEVVRSPEGSCVCFNLTAPFIASWNRF